MSHFQNISVMLIFLMSPGCRSWQMPQSLLGGPQAAFPRIFAPSEATGPPGSLMPESSVPAVGAPLGSPPAQLPGVLGGSSLSASLGLPVGPDNSVTVPNPLVVPVVRDEVTWEAIADVVASHFTIMRERRAVRNGEYMAEGMIETAPQTGATILESQRGDSVGSYNRWESTFQSIRRRATLRVVPDQAGYLVYLEVVKELEDLARPEEATAGAATLRTDGSLPERQLEAVRPNRESRFWIPIGRDIALEQRMLAQIRAAGGG